MRAAAVLAALVLIVVPGCGREEPPPRETWPLRVGDDAVLGYGAQTGAGGRLAPLVGDHLGWRPDGLPETGWVLLVLLDPAVYDALGALVIPLADAEAFEASLASTSRARRGPDGWRLLIEPHTWLDVMTRARRVLEAASSHSPMAVVRAVSEGFLGPGEGGEALELDVVLEDDRVLVVPSFEARAVCRRVAERVGGLREGDVADRRGVWSVSPHAVWLAFADVLEGVGRGSGVVRQVLEQLGRAHGGGDDFDLGILDVGRHLAEADLGGLDAWQMQYDDDDVHVTLAAREGSSWATVLAALRPVPVVPGTRFALHVERGELDASATDVARLLGRVVAWGMRATDWTLRAAGESGFLRADEPSDVARGFEDWGRALEGWGGLLVVTREPTYTIDVLSEEEFDLRALLEGHLDLLRSMVASLGGAAAVLRTIATSDGRLLCVDGDGEIVLTAGRDGDLAWFAQGEHAGAPPIVHEVRQALLETRGPDAPVALLTSDDAEDVYTVRVDGLRLHAHARMRWPR